MIMTLPWSGCGAERGTVSPSITTFCPSACLTGKRSLTSTGKLASSPAGETQVSSGALRSKKGGGDWIQEPTWAINLCLHNSRPCSYCLSVPAHDVKERRSEVIFVPLCFLLILRLLEPAHGGSFGCHSILLKLWERAVLPSGHSPLFTLPCACLPTADPLGSSLCSAGVQSLWEAPMFP